MHRLVTLLLIPVAFGQTGIITTITGTLSGYGGDGGPATLTPLDWPSSIAADAEGRAYFAELHSNRVARVNCDGLLQVIAGTGSPGSGADGPEATRSVTIQHAV